MSTEETKESHEDQVQITTIPPKIDEDDKRKLIFVLEQA